MKAAQVAAVVAQAGPPAGTNVAEWVAKSRQESSHNHRARDFVDQTHIGLWQVDVEHILPGASTDRLKYAAAVEVLEDPRRNFNAAKGLYAKGGWSHWDASGGRPTPTATDRRAAANPDPTGIPGSGESTAGTLGRVLEGAVSLPGDLTEAGGDLISGAAEAIRGGFGWAVDAVGILRDAAVWVGNPHNWVRALLVAGGVSLALVAVSAAVAPSAARLTGRVI